VLVCSLFGGTFGGVGIFWGEAGCCNGAMVCCVIITIVGGMGGDGWGYRRLVSRWSLGASKPTDSGRESVGFGTWEGGCSIVGVGSCGISADGASRAECAVVWRVCRWGSTGSCMGASIEVVGRLCGGCGGSTGWCGGERGCVFIVVGIGICSAAQKIARSCLLKASKSVLGNGSSWNVLVLREVAEAPGKRAGVVVATADRLGSWRRLSGGRKGKLATGFATAG